MNSHLLMTIIKKMLLIDGTCEITFERKIELGKNLPRPSYHNSLKTVETI